MITSVEVSGTGSNVAAFSATGTGQREFTIHYSGGSDFVVWLKDAQGNNVDLLVNTAGPYYGKISSSLTTGDYYLDISCIRALDDRYFTVCYAKKSNPHISPINYKRFR